MEKSYKLPSMDYKFSIQVKGSESQLMWTGDFMYRRPTLGERGKIDALRCKLNNDLTTIDPEIDILHSALAHLRYTLRESPDWWKNSDYGSNLYDTNVVIEIYNKILEFEKDWKKKILSGDSKDVESKDEEPT
jgi:hypothetical protein